MTYWPNPLDNSDNPKREDSNPTHTPTPWVLAESESAWVLAANSTDDGCTKVGYIDKGSDHKDEMARYNDGCFIIEAVNNYDALQAENEARVKELHEKEAIREILEMKIDSLERQKADIKELSELRLKALCKEQEKTWKLERQNSIYREALEKIVGSISGGMWAHHKTIALEALASKGGRSEN